MVTVNSSSSSSTVHSLYSSCTWSLLSTSSSSVQLYLLTSTCSLKSSSDNVVIISFDQVSSASTVFLSLCWLHATEATVLCYELWLHDELWTVQLCLLTLQIYNTCILANRLVCLCACIVHSRSIHFFNWCLTQCGVGDCGQPVKHRCQLEQTEASRVNARRSELLDLPDLYGPMSSSDSESVEYSIKKVLISTVSRISSGRSLSFYRKHHSWYTFFISD